MALKTILEIMTIRPYLSTKKPIELYQELVYLQISITTQNDVINPNHPAISTATFVKDGNSVCFKEN